MIDQTDTDGATADRKFAVVILAYLAMWLPVVEIVLRQLGTGGVAITAAFTFTLTRGVERPWLLVASGVLLVVYVVWRLNEQTDSAEGADT